MFQITTVTVNLTVHHMVHTLVTAALCAIVLLGCSSDAKIIELTDHNAESTIRDTPTLFVEFMAPWCGHCRNLAPAWQKLGKQLHGQIDLGIVDCIKNKVTCQKYQVQSYPTLIAFDEGRPKSPYRGERTLEAMKQYLQSGNFIDGPDNFVLKYFPTRGRAESIRLYLEELGLPYEMQAIEKADWPPIKKAGIESGDLLFGQLPALETGARTLVQSHAIMRYLSRKYAREHYGDDLDHSTMADMLADGTEDFRKVYGKLVYDPEFESKKSAYITDTLPAHFRNWERILSDGRENIVGKDFGISFVDFLAFDIFELNARLCPECMKIYPNVAAYIERIRNRPAIAAYLKSDRRPKYANGAIAFFDNEANPAPVA